MVVQNIKKAKKPFWKDFVNSFPIHDGDHFRKVLFQAYQILMFSDDHPSGQWQRRFGFSFKMQFVPIRGGVDRVALREQQRHPTEGDHYVVVWAEARRQLCQEGGGGEEWSDRGERGGGGLRAGQEECGAAESGDTEGDPRELGKAEPAYTERAEENRGEHQEADGVYEADEQFQILLDYLLPHTSFISKS